MIKKLLIAGGGTGGHIFPGLAVAEEWQKRGGDVVFVGTPAGQESKLIPKNGFRLEFIRIGTLKGSGILRRFKTLMQIPIAFFKAAKILLNEKPDVVLGIGGYASGPTCLAAFFLCIPTAITDQNAHPGLTNRILGKFVKKIFLSFSAAQDFFKKNKTYITGNPVRAKISYSAFPEFKNHLNILVCGGSQGSQAINQAVGDAMKILAAKNITIHLTHQTGTVDEKKFYDFYNDHQIPAKVLSFIDDMNAEYQKAQLVICRSGAGTVTELALAGRPAILIPYPFAADDHQKKNALVFTENHAAWLLEQKDLSGEILAALIEKLKNEPHLLEEASVRIKSLGKPDATQKLVDGLFALAG